MFYFMIKVLLSALIIAAISEISKRSTILGALLASLPLTSVLAFVWLYIDTGDSARVADLSMEIFWLVLPSLPLFLVMPMLVKSGWGFWLSLCVAGIVTAACYGIMLLLFKQYSIQS